MRGALHVLATILVVPYALLAAFFVLLGQAIGDGSLMAMLETLLVQATWLVPWGIIGFALFILLLAALGLHAACRWIGGLLLCLVACSSTLLVVLLTSSTIDVDEILFLLPCIGIAVFGGWLALAERPRRPVNA